MLKEIEPIENSSKEKFDPEKVYYLIGTAYSQNNTHYLIFLSEDGEEIRYRETSVYPYFFVRNSERTAVGIMDEIDSADKSKYVKNVEPVIRKNPLTGIEEKLFKITVTSPNYITNRYDPSKSVSSIFEEEELVQNHVSFYHVVLNEMGYIMGMPYKFPLRKPEMITQVPKDVRKDYRKVFERLDQDDLKMARQAMFMMHSRLPDLSKMIKVIDIEIKANMGESMDAELAEAPITSISVTWKDEGEIKTKVFVLSNEALENEPTGEKFNDGTYTKKIYETEKGLLIDAIRFINLLPQKIIVTYNGDTFDIPYISRRTELHNLSFGIEGYKISDKGYFSRWYKRWDDHYLVDLYQYFANNNIRTGAYLSEYENLKLDTIADIILDERKYDYEGRIEDLSSEELAFYNAKDTQLTFSLATHDDNFPAFILFFIMRFGNLSLENANRKGVTAWWSGYEYRHLHRTNFFYPNENMLPISSIGLKGGIVLGASAGLHYDVDIYDFSSLYPTMVIEHNICFSTLQCEHEECQENIYNVQGSDVNICTQRRGFIPSALSFLRNARIEIYKPKSENDRYYEMLSQFVKIYMNACFGAMANPGFAFTSVLAAMTITQTGRDALGTLQELIEEEDGEVIYGDSVLGTEGVIVKFDENEAPAVMSIEEVWKIGEEKGYVVQKRQDGKESMVVYGLHIWDGKGWNKVNRLIRHYTLKTIYRVSTGRGTVDVTEDHSLVNEDGEEFKPSQISEGIDPVSSFFTPPEERIEDEEEIKSTMLLFLFSMVGTASGTYTGYPSQRTVALHMHERLKERGMEIFDRCKDTVDALDANYKTYETSRNKKLVKFTSHSQLWAFVRRNIYVDDEKIKPLPSILSLPDEELRLVLEFLKDYYYNPKGNTDRWSIKSNSQMIVFTAISSHFGEPITVFPQPKGNVYHVYAMDDKQRKSTVSITRRLPEFVYDFETEDGTFMAGNVLCHNTDSVFVIGAKEGSDKRISEKMGIEVENEGHWELMLQHKKKNYLLINKDKVKIKGLRGKKRDVPKFVRGYFDKAIKSIEPSMSKEEMLDVIYDTLMEGLHDLKEGNFELSEIKRVQTLNKHIHPPMIGTDGEEIPCECGSCYVANTPVVASAKHLMAVLEQIGKDRGFVKSFGRKGVIMEYVKADGSWRHPSTVYPHQVDLDYYEKVFFRVFRQLTLPLGYTVKELIEKKKQSGLGEYF